MEFWLESVVAKLAGMEGWNHGTLMGPPSKINIEIPSEELEASRDTYLGAVQISFQQFTDCCVALTYFSLQHHYRREAWSKNNKNRAPHSECSHAVLPAAKLQ